MIIPKRRKAPKMGVRRPDPDKPMNTGHDAWVRGRRCAVENGDCFGRIEAHHVKSRGARGCDSDLVPLCLLHHGEGHGIGWETFARKHDTDLSKMAAALWQADVRHRIKWEQGRTG